jgi:RimJ/RimL family protein N-acetyltransferase
MPYLALIIALCAVQTFASEATPRRGRLASLIAEAEYRADCVVRLEPVAPPATLERVARPLEIEGTSIVLRVIRPDDAGAAAKAVDIYTDPRVAAMSGDRVTPEQVRRLIELGQADFSDMGWSGLINFAVLKRDRSGGEIMIGIAQASHSEFEVPRMKGLVTRRERWFEISYHLHPDAWGRGYASDVIETLALQLMIEQDAEGVYAQVDAANVGSQRALEKAKFTEIERRMFASIHGPVGIAHFALTRTDFENPPLRHGINLRTETDSSNRELVKLVIIGVVPDWNVVTIDKDDHTRNPPLPRAGSHLTQLTSVSDRPVFGNYLSVPDANPLGGPIYVSRLDLERFITSSIENSKLDRALFAARFAAHVRVPKMQSLMIDLSNAIPDDFPNLTVFERRRVLEGFASRVALERGGFIPFKLVILNGQGFDLFTRVDIVSLMKDDE